MMIQTMRTLLCKARRDEDGAAAIEFAFIAPILFILYFMTGEISQAIETNTKVGRIASLVGDLVGQLHNGTSAEELDAIMGIGASIIQPYGRSQPTIIIEHIKIVDESNPKALVTWSRKLEDGKPARAVAKDSRTTVSKEFLNAGTHLVRVTTQLGYRPIITWTAEQKASLGLLSAFDSINMSERYYLSFRMKKEGIACSDC